MDYFELYKARMQANGSNITNSQSNVTQDIINNSFKDSPSYKLSRIDNTEVDIRVIKGIKSNTKKVLFRPQYKTNIGRLIEFDNEKWLIVDFEEDEIHPYASVQLCNNTLKWRNELGVIVETPIVIGNLTLYSDGLDTSKYITTENGKRTINLPNNEVTRNLYIGQRFVINSNSVFAISHIDDFSMPGLMTLTMIQGSELPQDDLENNVAYNGGIQVEPVTTTEHIQGNDFCIINTQQTFKVLDGSGSVTGLSYSWFITDMDNNNTSLATILTADGTSCVIKANSNRQYGQVKLNAWCGNSHLEKIVNIKSIL